MQLGIFCLLKSFCIFVLENNIDMENIRKIGIMGLGQINSCTTENETEEISIKPKPIEKLIT